MSSTTVTEAPVTPEIMGDDRESDPRYQLAKKLRDEGCTVRDIVRTCGMSMSKFYEWFPASGNPKTRERTIRQMEDMKKLRALGETDASIARRFGTTRQRIHVLLGPRTHAPEDMMSINWKTTAKAHHELKRLARYVGAMAPITGKGAMEPSIPLMMEMMARGEIIVSAAPARIKPDLSDHFLNQELEEDDPDAKYLRD